MSALIGDGSSSASSQVVRSAQRYPHWMIGPFKAASMVASVAVLLLLLTPVIQSYALLVIAMFALAISLGVLSLVVGKASAMQKRIDNGPWVANRA